MPRLVQGVLGTLALVVGVTGYSVRDVFTGEEDRTAVTSTSTSTGEAGADPPQPPPDDGGQSNGSDRGRAAEAAEEKNDADELAPVTGAWEGRLDGVQDPSSFTSMTLAIETVDASASRSGSITLLNGACSYVLGLPSHETGGLRLTVGSLERSRGPESLCEQRGSRLLVTPAADRQVDVGFFDASTATDFQGRLQQAPP